MELELLKEKIDNYLYNYFNNKYDKTYQRVLFESMAYSVNIGGKRIRPILMLLTYSIYKKDYEKILPMSAAMEMIHTYSLIHDDLPCMDNDDLRRGKPTNHKVYGEALAVLAGDGLLNEAMNILFDFSLKNGEAALKASKEIAYSAGANGMIGGQVVDIINEGKKTTSLDELEFMHIKKTGELIKASVISGALLAEASEKDIDILKEYGYKLGLAFQIKDDILDVEGSVEKLGKAINSDEESDKTNYITLFGLEQCKIKCKELTNNCLELLGSLEGNTEELKKLTKILLIREN